MNVTTAEIDRVAALVAELSDAAVEMPAERLRAMTADERRLFDRLNVAAEAARTRGDTAAWLLNAQEASLVMLTAMMTPAPIVRALPKCARRSCTRHRAPGAEHCCPCCSYDTGHSRGCDASHSK